AKKKLRAERCGRANRSRDVVRRFKKAGLRPIGRNLLANRNSTPAIEAVARLPWVGRIVGIRVLVNGGNYAGVAVGLRDVKTGTYQAHVGSLDIRAASG